MFIRSLVAFCLFSIVVNAADYELPTARRPRGEELRGYVIGESPSWNRLGNQLFTIASVLAYAWDNDFQPIFPSLNMAEFQLSYNRDKMFFRLDNRDFPYIIHSQYVDKGLKYKPIRILKNNQNVLIKGYFECWKYFHHHRNEILELFAPSRSVHEYLYNKYGGLIEQPNTVAVHVRTFSKDVHHAGLIFLGLNYFERAFDEFTEDATFVVFSDRINWCKVNFQEAFPDRNFVYIEGNDHIEDLHLMSLMKNLIISNSTYSWWGAYLNTREDKVVVCPPQIFKDPAVVPIEDRYLPEWRILTYDFTNDPYPEDMLDYDELTADDTKKY